MNVSNNEKLNWIFFLRRSVSIRSDENNGCYGVVNVFAAISSMLNIAWPDVKLPILNINFWLYQAIIYITRNARKRRLPHNRYWCNKIRCDLICFETMVKQWVRLCLATIELRLPSYKQYSYLYWLNQITNHIKTKSHPDTYCQKNRMILETTIVSLVWK